MTYKPSFAAAIVLALGVIGLATTACEDGVSTGGGPAYVRTLHLAGEVGAVDILADGAYVFDIRAGYEPAPAVGADVGQTLLASDVSFAQGTDYVPVLPGALSAAVRVAGVPYGAPLLRVQQEVESGRFYTLVVVVSGGQNESFLLDDAPWDGAGSGARVVNAAGDETKVDVWVLPGDGRATRVGGRLEVGQTAGYFPFDGGTQLGLDENQDAVPDLFFDVPLVDQGEAVTLFAVSHGGSLGIVSQDMDGVANLSIAAPAPGR